MVNHIQSFLPENIQFPLFAFHQENNPKILREQGRLRTLTHANMNSNPFIFA